MDYMETLEAKKKALREQQEQVDQLIEAEKAKREQDRKIDLAGLYRSMDSLIKTSSSSFSEISIGEVIEYDYEQGHECADPYSRTIDVEISGRARAENEPIYTITPADLKRFSGIDEATLVVSYLIPYDLVKDDPFFKENDK